MPRECVSIQVGQCGNQVATAFWRRIGFEHGIDGAGRVCTDTLLDDRKDVFYYESDDSRYVPRAILVDLEPAAIGGVLRASGVGGLFPLESVFDNTMAGGGGAGNCWAEGYVAAQRQAEVFTEMIRREAENCASLESFMLWHSLAGGTGSGLGSHLLEHLSDAYPRKIITTNSILPGRYTASDTVVQSYNAVLALARLSDEADMVTLFDNETLTRPAMALNLEEARRAREEGGAGFLRANERIAASVAGLTAAVRFPAHAALDMTTLAATLVPTPRLHFLTPAVAPAPSAAERLRLSRALPTGLPEDAPLAAPAYLRGLGAGSTVGNVLQDLFSSHSALVDFRVTQEQPARPGTIVAAAALVAGAGVTHSALHSAVAASREHRFVPWGPANLQTILQRRSPLLEAPSAPGEPRVPAVSGTLLSNTTGVRHTLHGIFRSFQSTWSRRGYFSSFLSALPDDGSAGRGATAEMEAAADVVRGVIEEYARAEQPDYLTTYTA